MTKHDLATIDRVQLAAVGGGASAALPGPAAPLLLPKPAPMGGPKYSAAWWDLVRSRGLFK